jgi:hypothetical protein
MAAYLLGTRAFVDLMRRVKNPVKDWADGLNTTSEQLYVSVISIGQVRAEIEALPAADPRKALWQRHFQSAVQRFQQYTHDVDLPIANRWASLLPLALERIDAKTGARESVGADSRLVLATAMARDLILVDKTGPCHLVLMSQGLQLFDPYP